MRILISSLQVSLSGSKGHLHPAIEIALEAKRQGHTVAILPMPSRLGKADKLQLEKAEIEYIEPPNVPSGVIKTPEELALLASDKERVHLAYSSFLLEPIPYQAASIEKILKGYNPDVVLYDLLVYLVPLIARSLGIPDFGYCAGLKLLAQESLLGSYAEVARKLSEKRTELLSEFYQNLDFHHLELLSNYAQVVFATPSLMADAAYKAGCHLVGPLPSSKERGDHLADFLLPDGKFVVLSFGSVLDPYDFPKITDSIVRATNALGLKLVIGSRKFSKEHQFPEHVQVLPYLPIPRLIPSAEAYIHHGGANSFSEALRLGARQILIPLTTDQPIQAHYLKQIDAGLTLPPQEVNHNAIEQALEVLGNPEHPIHNNIARLREEYAAESGASNFLTLITDSLRGKIGIRKSWGLGSKIYLILTILFQKVDMNFEVVNETTHRN